MLRIQSETPPTNSYSQSEHKISFAESFDLRFQQFCSLQQNENQSLDVFFKNSSTTSPPSPTIWKNQDLI